MAGAPPPPGPKRQARLVFADDDEAELVEFRRNVKRRGPGAKTLVDLLRGNVSFARRRASAPVASYDDESADEHEPRLEMVKGGRE